MLGCVWLNPTSIFLIASREHEVQKQIKIQSLKTLPKIGVPHIPQKRCISGNFRTVNCQQLTTNTLGSL
ncbi:hypothetical protein VF04_09055 [Nostoc linckia z7]|uniref:Uncharacterized protein n=2 Tax=Nostoc linckia TaxID=92942 RepID=A0A9Q5ZEG3_NOSLI|nr:hypothetical protein VF02_13790 [Nostoc linckia z1]PHJ69437.1 hypothetical protein VF05_13425 [Nostoc linckia z3]PHJ74720.1 hypothetical protein VF03_12870 [Nostoc linckia z2]PHJ82445.1 hypothetical protein VF06_15870 [Nostoc linckia z4]PHJ88519.1 hypothetical protein VF07_15650 [Nostoc linckia z6]PHJ98661.1 hypothetical protein VF04_09055 [Nostoc linckia z7]PHK05499.1 hypothetical protein VF08_07855 [Nostoc linckia z8]PHK21870.1 hypothetical protein VF11_07505 [Nostoc linckia z14]PHK265